MGKTIWLKGTTQKLLEEAMEKYDVNTYNDAICKINEEIEYLSKYVY